MTRNDLFYKVLFAIEIALLPIVIFSYLFIEEWAVGLFIGAIVVCKIWREIFKDRDSRSHDLISRFASILVLATLITFFMVEGYINIALGVVALVIAVLMQLLSIVTFKKRISETIRAVDSCFVIFECMTLACMIFLVFYAFTTNIGLFALILTGTLSIVYKVYYVFKYMNIREKIAGIFKKK